MPENIDTALFYEIYLTPIQSYKKKKLFQILGELLSANKAHYERCLPESISFQETRIKYGLDVNEINNTIEEYINQKYQARIRRVYHGQIVVARMSFDKVSDYYNYGGYYMIKNYGAEWRL